MEFVGHVLKPDGVCFLAQTREKVLDFPFPEKQKHLKSFLGLVNYFRDHVKGLSSMVKPLNNMVNPDKKNTLITWSPKMEQVFRTVPTALMITSDGTSSEQRLENEGKRLVTTEPAIDAELREKTREVHNSVSGHFGVEYTRKVLAGRGGGGKE